MSGAAGRRHYEDQAVIMSNFARLLILVLALGSGLATQLRADPGPLVLWYTNAATSWTQEALPVGNGKLGAMIFGGVTTEQIQFNEDTIWNGQPHFYENLSATPAHLASIQSKVFARTDPYSEAQPYFMSQPLRQPAFQPAGVLSLTFPHSGTANYLRSLDLNTATASVRYDYSGVTYYRDVFASAPSNKVIVVRLAASQPGQISFSCSMSTLQTGTFSTSGNDLVMRAKVTAQPRAEYYATGLTNAIEYEARVRVVAEGGTVTAGASSISVANADAVTLLLSVASNFVNYQDLSANAGLICSNNLAAAAANTFGQLRQWQLADYQPLFQRVVLDLGATSKTNLPTGLRLRRIVEGNDPQLVTLYFQLARYLTISGSRPGSQPLTLQGKWNEVTNPSWDSKMTLNINEELNYSGTEIANLSECHLPLFDMIQDLSVTGNRVARATYYSDGWVVHHNTDLWRAAAPINGRDGIWPTGGAWLCQHLWMHYQYTGDTNWLAATAYPLMKGAAQFFLGSLIPHATNPNWRVTNPSYSPEHDWPGTPAVSNVPGPTMDNELIRDLFNNVIQASTVLGVDASFRADVAAMRDKLPPNQIGRLGQLQEWLEDVDGATDAHRHMSHLVGLWPGETISPFYTPFMAAAAKVSCDIRGNGDIGWGKSWRVNLRNRLLDADRAYLILTNLIADPKISTNMVFHDNPNRQVDAIFGSMCGVAEMFLQSHSGEVSLLPSLPSRWTNGMVSGLCARGGFQVDIAWENNRLVQANVLSKLGNVCRLRSKWPVDIKLGTNLVSAAMVLPGLYEFPTITGSNFTVVAANVAETEVLAATFSAGDTHQVLTNSAFSGFRGTRLNASASGDFVTYTLTNLNAGCYRISVGADAGANRGMFQLACGANGGALTNVGGVQDTYSPTNLVYCLPTNAVTTTLLWTNLVREFDCGVWQAPSNGACQFRFAIAGKHANSTGYALVLDYVKLTPVPAPPQVSALEQWRIEKFGADAGNPEIAGDAADPDHDGLPNLLEYALGREPLVPDAAGFLTAKEDMGYLSVAYHRAKAATDVTVSVEVAGEFAAGWSVNTGPTVVTDDGNGLTETVKVADSVPIQSAPQRYMRLRAHL